MNNDDILVAIEIITYNHERFLAKALDSVLMQEVGFKYEIIVGEDCSTDNTRQILLEYKEKHPDKFRLLLHDKNVGMRKNAEAVSALSAESNSKYIAVLEGDDYWIDPQKLQIQIDAMEEYPDCYISFHAAEMRFGEDDHGKVVGKHCDGNRLFSTSEVILGGGGFSPSTSVIYRRDLVATLPDLYYEVPAGDYFLQMLGSLHGGFLYIDRVMSVYRQGMEGSWNSFMKDRRKRERFAEGSLKGLNDINLFLDEKYDDEIRQRIANLDYEMAIFYLNGGLYKEFKENMEKAHGSDKLDSKAFLIDHKLRHLPRALLFLRSLKKHLGQ